MPRPMLPPRDMAMATLFALPVPTTHMAAAMVCMAVPRRRGGLELARARILPLTPLIVADGASHLLPHVGIPRLIGSARFGHDARRGDSTLMQCRRSQRQQPAQLAWYAGIPLTSARTATATGTLRRDDLSLERFAGQLFPFGLLLGSEHALQFFVRGFA